jgi:hypothetical protein
MVTCGKKEKASIKVWSAEVGKAPGNFHRGRYAQQDHLLPSVHLCI